MKKPRYEHTLRFTNEFDKITVFIFNMQEIDELF